MRQLPDWDSDDPFSDGFLPAFDPDYPDELYIGVLRPGAEEHLDRYLDRPIEAFSCCYEMRTLGHIPDHWMEALGPPVSPCAWLEFYFCSGETARRLLSPDVERLYPVLPAGPDGTDLSEWAPIAPAALPDCERYAIMRAIPNY